MTIKQLKVTIVYRSEYLVIECPHCGHREYLDTEELLFSGNATGQQMHCIECGGLMEFEE